MRKIYLIILGVLLSANIAYAWVTLEIQPSTQRTSRSDFAEDHLDLVVKENGKAITSEYFYSSYGDASANVEHDSKGDVFILLRHGEGRGTSVRKEYITVYRYEKGLDRLITFPVSGFAGSRAKWEYEFMISKPKSGGLQFNLTRKLSGNDPLMYPSQEDRTIFIK